MPTETFDSRTDPFISPEQVTPEEASGSLAEAGLPDAELLSNAQKAKLLRALTLLTKEQAVTLALDIYEPDLTNREIALLVVTLLPNASATLGSLKSRLHRARQALAERLKTIETQSDAAADDELNFDDYDILDYILQGLDLTKFQEYMQEKKLTGSIAAAASIVDSADDTEIPETSTLTTPSEPSEEAEAEPSDIPYHLADETEVPSEAEIRAAEAALAAGAVAEVTAETQPATLAELNEFFIENYQAWLRFVRNRVGTNARFGSTYDDLVQDTFEQLYRGVDEGRYRIRELKPYVYAVLRSKISDYFRDLRKVQRAARLQIFDPGEYYSATEDTAVTNVAANETTVRKPKIIANRTPKPTPQTDRDILELYFNNLSKASLRAAHQARQPLSPEDRAAAERTRVADIRAKIRAQTPAVSGQIMATGEPVPPDAIPISTEKVSDQPMSGPEEKTTQETVDRSQRDSIPDLLEIPPPTIEAQFSHLPEPEPLPEIAPVQPEPQKKKRKKRTIGTTNLAKQVKTRTKAEETKPPIPVARTEVLREKPEEEVLEDAANFDEAALGELYDRYGARIYSYIYRRTGNSAIAEDLSAQVFLNMLEAIREGKHWHSSFSGWLYRIAHNAVIDHYRKRDREKAADLEDAADIVAVNYNPVAVTFSNIDAEDLREAITRLTEEQAEVITLRFLDGYSNNEVAKMMDTTVGAVKALQYRALEALRQMMGVTKGSKSEK